MPGKNNEDYIVSARVDTKPLQQYSKQVDDLATKMEALTKLIDTLQRSTITSSASQSFVTQLKGQLDALKQSAQEASTGLQKVQEGARYKRTRQGDLVGDEPNGRLPNLQRAARYPGSPTGSLEDRERYFRAQISDQQQNQRVKENIRLQMELANRPSAPVRLFDSVVNARTLSTMGALAQGNAGPFVRSVGSSMMGAMFRPAPPTATGVRATTYGRLSGLLGGRQPGQDQFGDYAETAPQDTTLGAEGGGGGGGGGILGGGGGLGGLSLPSFGGGGAAAKTADTAAADAAKAAKGGSWFGRFTNWFGSMGSKLSLGNILGALSWIGPAAMSGAEMGSEGGGDGALAGGAADVLGTGALKLLGARGGLLGLFGKIGSLGATGFNLANLFTGGSLGQSVLSGVGIGKSPSGGISLGGNGTTGVPTWMNALGLLMGGGGLLGALGVGGTGLAAALTPGSGMPSSLRGGITSLMGGKLGMLSKLGLLGAGIYGYTSSLTSNAAQYQLGIANTVGGAGYASGQQTPGSLWGQIYANPKSVGMRYLYDANTSFRTAQVLGEGGIRAGGTSGLIPALTTTMAFARGSGLDPTQVAQLTATLVTQGRMSVDEVNKVFQTIQKQAQLTGVPLAKMADSFKTMEQSTNGMVNSRAGVLGLTAMQQMLGPGYNVGTLMAPASSLYGSNRLAARYALGVSSAQFTAGQHNPALMFGYMSKFVNKMFPNLSSSSDSQDLAAQMLQNLGLASYSGLNPDQITQFVQDMASGQNPQQIAKTLGKKIHLQSPSKYNNQMVGVANDVTSAFDKLKQHLQNLQDTFGNLNSTVFQLQDSMMKVVASTTGNVYQLPSSSPRTGQAGGSVPHGAAPGLGASSAGVVPRGALNVQRWRQALALNQAVPNIPWQVFYAWAQGEGNPGANQNNPLNIPYYSNISSLTSQGETLGAAGTAAFPTLAKGATATANFLKSNPNFAGILQAAQSGNPTAILNAIMASPWASSHYQPPNATPLTNLFNQDFTPQPIVIIDRTKGGIDVQNPNSSGATTHGPTRYGPPSRHTS